MKKGQKQIIKYTLIGISAVALDFAVYYLASFYWPKSLTICKALGFIVGSFYTFFLNKAWTWNNKDKTNLSQFTKFILIYGISLLINVVVNQIFWDILPEHLFSFQIISPSEKVLLTKTAALNKAFAFIIATLASAIWNFTGQKYWVFKTIIKDGKEIIVIEEDVDEE
jgi:putative flippase GtrA